MTPSSTLPAAARILVSGGGIAGLSLAYWLEHYGFQTTVIEQAPSLRTEGYGIEFSGSGWDVAERMGLLPKIQERKLSAPYFIFKDKAGRSLVRLQMASFFEAVQDKMVQIMRSDLQTTLFESVQGRVPIYFGNAIEQIEQHDQFVSVSFKNGTQEHFDLVIGADGLHSQVRRLVFGEEAQFARFLGYYFATCSLPNLDDFDQGAFMHLDHKRQVMIYPDGRGRYVGLFAFQAAYQGSIPQQQRMAMLHEAYKGAGWVVPEMLASIADNRSVYLDSFSQIEMPTWSRGRVAVVGDAAYCPTLLSGMGASLAMGGAYILAQELHRCGDYAQAFAAYEQRVRPFIEKKQRGARRFAATFIPSNRFARYLSYATVYALFNPLLTPFVGKRIGMDSLLRVA